MNLTSRIRLGALAPILAIGFSFGTARADDMPHFQPGQWEYQRVVAGATAKPQTFSRKDCGDPAVNMRKQKEQLAKTGCKALPTTHSGNRWSYGATCTIHGV